MVAIQVLLVGAFLVLLVRFLTNPFSYHSKAWIKILTILFTVAAVLAIIFPESATVFAHLLGVGRGADLLLYLLALSFIFTVITLYIKSKSDQRAITALVRKIAIIETELRLKSKD